MDSLESMLIKCNIIESNIGDYAGTDKTSKEPLIVTGMRVDKVENKMDEPISKLLSVADTGYIKESVFDRYNRCGVVELFKEYLDEKYRSTSEKVVDYKEKIVDRLVKLQTSKAFILPVSIGRKAEYIDNDITYTGNIIRIEYKVNKDTLKIESTIRIKDRNNPSVCMQFSDFGKTWWVKGVKQGCEEADDGMIEMLNNGVIKPININNDIIIDNMYIYKSRSTGFEIVGYADKDGYKLNGIRDEECKSEAVKKLKKNLTYLSHMQRIIGVYGLNEEKKVEV